MAKLIHRTFEEAIVEIEREIEDNKKVMLSAKERILNLETEIYKLQKNEILNHFDIGDILFFDDYVFSFDMVEICCGFIRTMRKVNIKTKEKIQYTIYPQPICKLCELYKEGRFATEDEINLFEEAFSENTRE